MSEHVIEVDVGGSHRDNNETEVEIDSQFEIDQHSREKLEFLKNKPNMTVFRESKSSISDEEDGSSNHTGSLLIDEECDVDEESDEVPEGEDEDNEEEVKSGGRRKRKKRVDYQYDDQLEDDDYDLLEENLGVKVKRRKFKRIRNVGDDDSDEDETLGDKETIASRLFEGGDDEELLDLTESREDGQHRTEEFDSDESDDSENDFIVDDNGYSASDRLNLARCTDASLTTARDIFGDDFDYNEIVAVGEDSDEDEEVVNQKLNTTKIQEVYEPILLELAGMTSLQRTIQKADIPERFIIRGPKLTDKQIAEMAVEVEVTNDLEEEMAKESKWIFDNLFKRLEPILLERAKTNLKNDETNSKDTRRNDECMSIVGPAFSTIANANDEWDENDNEVGTIQPKTSDNEKDDGSNSQAVSEEINIDTLEKNLKAEFKRLREKMELRILKIISLIRVKKLEVPFISYYQKDDVFSRTEGADYEDFTIKDLWSIHKHDLLFQHFNKKKQTLLLQLNQMEDFQKSTDSDTTVLSRILVDVETVTNPQELEDFYMFFKMSFSTELPVMREMVRGKIRESKRLMAAEESGDESPEEEESRLPKMISGGRQNKFKMMQESVGNLLDKFGLTPWEFAENLYLNYLKHEALPCENTPFHEASKCVSEKCPDAAELLLTAKRLLGYKVSRDPLARKALRKVFMKGAHISCTPTKKGLQIIDENHPAYKIKHLYRKPVQDFCGDEFLILHVAENDKLIEIKIGERMIGSKGQDYDIEAKELCFNDDYSTAAQSWNFARSDVVGFALEDHLLPELRKELHVKLVNEAKQFVLKACTQKLAKYLEVAPYKPKSTFENQKERKSFVIGISYSTNYSDPAYASVLNSNGSVLDYIRLKNLTKRLYSFRESDKLSKEVDLYLLKDLITQKRPVVIAISGESRTAKTLKSEIEELLVELGEEAIEVEIVDNELGRVYSYCQIGREEFPPEYPPTLRESISIGRKLIDPLCEYAQLYNDDEDILCLKFHPLQDHIPKDDFLEGLQIELINQTNQVGVELNDLVAHPHRANILQFVCGFGRQKANCCLKIMRLDRTQFENRSQLITHLNIGPNLFVNCSGFIKVDVKGLVDPEHFVETLDNTRVHPEHFEWAKKIATDSIDEGTEYDDPVDYVLEHPEVMKFGLVMKDFALALQQRGFEYKERVLLDIEREFKVGPFKDNRLEYRSPTEEEIFYMLTKETPNSFYIGKLVSATIVDIKRKKPDKSTLENAMPEKQDIKTCPICLKSDFPALKDLWEHFDSEACPGPCVGIGIKLDNEVKGIIELDKLSDSNVQDPSTRVRVGQTVMCRIEDIDTTRFFVKATCRSSDLVDKSRIFKPKKDLHYDTTAENELIEKLQAEQTRKQPATAYVRRAIIHPCFKNISYIDAERQLNSMDQGDIVIRPSSKGSNHLTMSWKVTTAVTQHIDVLEQNKPNQFSIGTSLLVNNEEYEDLDEIIARCINPMASNVRDVLNYKYYKTIETKEEISNYLKSESEWKKNNKKIHYFIQASKEFPGKFILTYMPTTKIVQEFFTVTPSGCRFRGQSFDGFDSMLCWFKLHYHEVKDMTPKTPAKLTASHYRNPFTLNSSELTAMNPVMHTPATMKAYANSTIFMTPAHKIPLPLPPSMTDLNNEKLRNATSRSVIGSRSTTDVDDDWD